MELQSLFNLIARLDQEQQATVEEFVRFLSEKSSQGPRKVTFREALDAFTAEHPELLRLLAK
jgi:Ca2+-binding EF-hand superfamily protein